MTRQTETASRALLLTLLASFLSYYVFKAAYLLGPPSYKYNLRFTFLEIFSSYAKSEISSKKSRVLGVTLQNFFEVNLDIFISLDLFFIIHCSKSQVFLSFLWLELKFSSARASIIIISFK